MRKNLIRMLLGAVILITSAGAGYLLSSRLGPEVLRLEAERQLAKVMRGRVSIERAKLRVGWGLRIEGETIRVYPSPSGPGLSARHATATIDAVALVRGRFRLRSLYVEGLHMEIERSVSDRWSPKPVAHLDTRGRARDPADLEHKLDLLKVFEKTARVLLAKPLIANHMEIRNASVRMVDRHVRGLRTQPLELRIEGIDGTLAHRWLPRGGELSVRGTLVDPARNRIPLEISGRRRGDGHMSLTVAGTGFHLASVGDYVQPQDPESRRLRAVDALAAGATRPFEGLISGVVSYELLSEEHGVLEIDAILKELVAAVPRGNELLPIRSANAKLRGRLEQHPGRLRLPKLEFRGNDVAVELSATLERPLRASSTADLALDLYGAGLDEVKSVISALPESDRESLLRLADRVESGNIVRIGGKGSARISLWRQLLGAELRTLPRGFVIGAQIADVTVGTGPGGRITGLSALLEWSGDRIRFHDAHARYNEARLPILDLELVGVSHLFEGPAASRALVATPEPIPGLPHFLDLVSGSGGEAPAPPILLEVDFLDHPALRWPLRGAKLLIQPEKDGRRISVTRGSWAGAPIRGQVLWRRSPENRVEVTLEASPPSSGTSLPLGAAPTPETASHAASHDPEAPRLPSRWAAGEFQIASLEGSRLPAASIAGAFAMDGSLLVLSGVRAPLTPRGWLAGGAAVGLSEGATLPIDLEFDIKEGDATALTEALGFPDDFASGTILARGKLAGRVTPGASVLSVLEGFADIEAHDGEVRQSVPLVSAIAHATEGWNPLAASSALRYESIEMRLYFDHGRIHAEGFRLDGPMRVYCAGDFDVARPGRAVQAEIGIFILRHMDRLLGKIPLVNNLIPGGKEKGLFGVYFEAKGTIEEPKLSALALRSLTDGAPLPDLIKAPFSAIREFLESQSEAAAAPADDPLGEAMEEARRQLEEGY
ncbi:MAG: hypothetical protein JRG96_17715 [Deltaproteobacteria bacterium]|nr:hypothetical protein [Deltaproteobacteria bacterium]MBW2420720.1 hypothetical protein [Deltaproteobacteria bacterium]